MNATQPTVSLRDRRFRFYWRMRAHIAPRLEFSQAIYERVLADAVPSRRWLDVGCGNKLLPAWRAPQAERLVRSVKHVVGVDYDHESLTQHRNISERVRADITTLPFRDGSFDVVTANMVLEHVKDPDRLLSEIFRVLAPGGVFIAHTPNLRGYATVLARLLPEAVKPRIVGWLHGRAEADVYRTYYRINSESALRQTAARAGFSRVTVRHLVSDAQLVMIPPLVVLELLMIRLLMTRPFRRFRIYLIAAMEKPADPRPGMQPAAAAGAGRA
jgi:ubiquinone/menaquinone biosynthesis C-methylase UbiE